MAFCWRDEAYSNVPVLGVVPTDEVPYPGPRIVQTFNVASQYSNRPRVLVRVSQLGDNYPDSGGGAKQVNAYFIFFFFHERML